MYLHQAVTGGGEEEIRSQVTQLMFAAARGTGGGKGVGAKVKLVIHPFTVKEGRDSRKRRSVVANWTRVESTTILIAFPNT